MYVPFESMPDDGRVWIFQADRQLGDNEVEQMREMLRKFTDGWQGHGRDLKASFEIKYSRFVVLCVDEKAEGVSGCAIDASMNCVKQLETVFKIDLTNKMNIAYRAEDAIAIVPYAFFQNLAKEGIISTNTIVFNNLVSSKKALETQWEVCAEDSWHKRCF